MGNEKECRFRGGFGEWNERISICMVFFNETIEQSVLIVVIFDYLNEFFDFYGNFLLTFAEKSCIMVGSLVQMK